MTKAKSAMKPQIHESPDHGAHDNGDNHLTEGSVMPGNNLGNYKPLIIILIFCFLIPLFQIRPLDLQEFIYSFMGYFFIFLSLFKFFDLKGFADDFATYDLVTKQIRAYGYVYPFRGSAQERPKFLAWGLSPFADKASKGRVDFRITNSDAL